VLWKAWDEKDGDVFWETELGKGRPGWHIECSAMALAHLGKTLDIHAGAVDLIFPHHENEIAQSEAATGKPFSRFWVHGEHLMVDGKKMAKRFKNFFTLHDLLAKGFKPAGIRYFLLSSHYRQQLNLTFDALHAAENTVARLFNFRRRLQEWTGGKHNDFAKTLCEKALEEFGNAMDDDLNTPMALAAVFGLENEVNKLMEEQALDEKEAALVLKTLEKIDSVLGLFAFAEQVKLALPEKEIEKLVAEREAAKAAKDYKTADKIRADLKKKGIILEDTPSGPKWRPAV